MGINHAPLSIGFQQATTDVKAGGAADFSRVKQRVVRRAAADINIQHPAHPLLRQALRSGAVTGNDRFQMRPGAGDHKVAQRLRERHDRRTGVAGFWRFRR
ncbi:Uncharacterised protein [Salmonella enterica subsp. enterica]|uniref:Uncharacterized protein n=1 Tax=Salmonella enterica I TaxID=59201 RepID=A0A3S4HXS1_SALET|nr:Uncharacterised protein [Salmonella enterica subsp. enterica]